MRCFNSHTHLGMISTIKLFSMPIASCGHHYSFFTCWCGGKDLFPHEFQAHRAVLFAAVCVLCVRPQNSFTQSLYQDHPSPAQPQPREPLVSQPPMSCRSSPFSVLPVLAVSVPTEPTSDIPTWVPCGSDLLFSWIL